MRVIGNDFITNFLCHRRYCTLMNPRLLNDSEWRSLDKRSTDNSGVSIWAILWEGRKNHKNKQTMMQVCTHILFYTLGRYIFCIYIYTYIVYIFVSYSLRHRGNSYGWKLSKAGILNTGIICPSLYFPPFAHFFRYYRKIPNISMQYNVQVTV